MKNYTDDCLMGIGMCLWVLETSFKNLIKLEQQNKAILNSWVSSGGSNASTIENNSNGFVSIANRNKQAFKKPNFSPLVSRNMQDPTGQYLWLFSGTK
jgi:hypothetical protein